MPIIFKEWIVRNDLRANPRSGFIFGDNVQRSGTGGQAKEMRGEPNAIGVVTKWAPSLSPRAFFDDTAACKMLVERDLLVVDRWLRAGRDVYVPADGIGTGLARLHIVAPNLDNFIKQWIGNRA